MDALEQALRRAVALRPEKIVISNPLEGAVFRRVGAALKEGKAGEYYQFESFTQTQAFHRNIGPDALYDELLSLMAQYRQLEAWGQGRYFSLKRTKKGGILTNSRQSEHARGARPHDEQKQYLLKEGTDIPPLVDLGVFTSEGRVARRMHDKYRQINRFVEMIDDGLRDHAGGPLNVLDFGCGKSYLTFVLYHYLTNVKKIDARISGLDLKADVVENCNRIARKYGYDKLRFEVGDIAGYDPREPADIVISLHACDTATDHALLRAIRGGARMIFAVPCCQHELNAQIESERLRILSEYGVIKERVSALLTDAIRANLLTCCGYRTQVLEFIDIEHSPKNLMLRAKRANLSKETRERALRDVRAAMAEFNLSPALYRLLEEGGLIAD